MKRNRLSHYGFVSAVWLVAGACFLGLTSAARASDNLVAACDRLAASPFDPEKAAPGVILEKIDASSALEACQAAYKAHPGLGRVAFQLGRIELQQKNYPVALELYRQATEKNYPLAHVDIGYIYDNGLGVAQDYATAMQHYRTAADAGIGLAMNNVGDLYAQGLGTDRDEAKATEFFQKAMEAGYDPAAYNFAKMLLMRHTPGADPAPVVKAFFEAAKRNAYAQTDIGHFYRDGSMGLPKDELAARAHFEAGVARGDHWGTLFIAQMDGFAPDADETARKDAIRALKDLTTSTDESVIAPAQALLGRLLLRQDEAQARHLIEQAFAANPRLAVTMSARAALLSSEGTLQEADTLLAQAIEVEPTWAPLYRQRADIVEGMGDTTKAAQLREQAETAVSGRFFLN